MLTLGLTVEVIMGVSNKAADLFASITEAAIPLEASFCETREPP